MQATPFVSAGEKNKHRRSDRNRHIAENSQMLINSRVGRTPTYQSQRIYFCLPDDVSNKLKPKLLKERESLSLCWKAAVSNPLSIYVMFTCNY